MNKFLSFFSIRMGLLWGALVFMSVSAYAVGPSLTYHGRLLKSDGEAVSGTVQFRVQILSPGNERCLLWEEIQTLDLSSSGGVFVLGINDGSGTRTDGGSLSFPELMANNKAFSFGAGKCMIGNTYIPVVHDGRKLQISFNDGSFAGWEDAPSQDLNYVPKAIDALQVGGFPESSLVRVAEADGTLNNISPLSNSSYTKLLDLIAGTSTMYMSASSQGANLPVMSSDPSSPVAGQIWFDSATGKIKYESGSGTQTLGTTSGSPVTVDLAADVTGVLPIANGGTGASSQATAANAILPTQTGNGGKLLQTDGSNVQWVNGSSGTVSSVDILVPSYMNAIGGPITSSGAITLSFGSQTANKFFAAPNASSGAPSFRSLLSTDLMSAVGGAWFTATGLCANGTSLQYVSATDTVSCQAYSITSAQVSAALGYSPANGSSYILKAGDTMTGALALPVDGLVAGTNQLVLSGGNVGIGTASPASLLDVNGTITAPAINTAGTFSLQSYGGTVATFRNSGNAMTVPLNITRASSGNTANVAVLNLAATDTTNSGNLTGLKVDNTGVVGGNSYAATFMGGNVGIGTTDPVSALHIASGNLAVGNGYINNDGGNEGLSIDTTGRATLTVLSGAVSAPLTLKNTSGAIGSGANLMFRNGSVPTTEFHSIVESAGGNSALLVYTRGANVMSERMRITSTGFIGVGTDTPSYLLDVQGGDINASGSVRAAGVALTSDIRFKRNIASIENSLEKILSLQGVTYDWRQDEFPERHFSSEKQIGVIAQKVEEYFPEVVMTDKSGFKSVNYPALVAPLIESVKSLYQRLVAVDVRTTKLEESKADKAEIEMLKKQNLALIKYLCARDPQAEFCGH